MNRALPSLKVEYLDITLTVLLNQQNRLLNPNQAGWGAFGFFMHRVGYRAVKKKFSMSWP